MSFGPVLHWQLSEGQIVFLLLCFYLWDWYFILNQILLDIESLLIILSKIMITRIIYSQTWYLFEFEICEKIACLFLVPTQEVNFSSADDNF